MDGSRNNVIAVTKLRTFDVSLSASDIRLDGNENPFKAQIANTKNTLAKESSVYLDSFVRGDNVRSENVEISTMKSGRKKSNR